MAVAVVAVVECDSATSCDAASHGRAAPLEKEGALEQRNFLVSLAVTVVVRNKAWERVVAVALHKDYRLLLLLLAVRLP